MSHSRERAEKTCLNCNADLYGRFCHNCGQENTDPRESFWSIVSHFFNDITHFDGKFYKTTGLLLAKPGFLPQEYVKGRRARYLHPIRLYLFTSFVFFLVFYSMSFYPQITIDTPDAPGTPSRDVYFNPIDTIVGISNREINYSTVKEYDSVQRTLPEEKRDNWITRKMIQSSVERRHKYGGKSYAMVQSVLDNFIHSFPYLLFISLPISALFLHMLYFGNRNNVYAGHAIFLVYLYVSTFLVLLIYFAAGNLEQYLNAPWLNLVQAALLLYIGIYALIAMKRFYGQGWGRTILKFSVWSLLAFVTILILFVIFLLLSLFKV